MTKVIGVLDFGKLSNLLSISNAIKKIGYQPKIISHYKELYKCKNVIIPGVGSFSEGMKQLKKNKFDIAIKETSNDIKFLGICLGMQFFAKDSNEFKKTNGLNIINCSVKKITHLKKLPVIGFSKIQFKPKSLFFKINKNSEFYFMHSFHLKNLNKKYVTSYANYNGKEIVSSFKFNNFYGVQFHPEKSREVGLLILKNFINE